MAIIFVTTQRILDSRFVPETKVTETGAKSPGSRRERFLARVGVGYLKGIMRAFHDFRCDADFAITIAQGQASISGKVACKTSGIEDDVKYAVGYLTRAARTLAEKSPKLEVSLRLHQKLKADK